MSDLLWERVYRTDYSRTFRAVVPGGWLYRHSFPANESGGYGQMMVFVPKPASNPRFGKKPAP